MADVEKNDAKHGGVQELERHISQESNLSDQAHIDAFTPEEQKKIIWRIDRRLVLTCGFMYCVSLMDRTNLGIAAVGGMAVGKFIRTCRIPVIMLMMDPDLNLIGYRYNTITLVFFLTYVLLQPVATVVLRKVGPRVFLPLITILWGVVAMCFGFLTTWKQMVGMRLILGVFEAGFFPGQYKLVVVNHAVAILTVGSLGCAYLLSCWYPRFELQKRNAVFYLIGSMASAFSGIIAYGFYNMQGLGNLGPDYARLVVYSNVTMPDVKPFEPYRLTGLSGWRWIVSRTPQSSHQARANKVYSSSCKVSSPSSSV